MAQTGKQQRNCDLFTLLWLFAVKNLKPSPWHMSQVSSVLCSRKMAQAWPALAIPMGLNCSQLPKQWISTQTLSVVFGLWPVQKLYLGSGEPAGCPGAQQLLGLCQSLGNMAWFKLECGRSLGQITAALRTTGQKRSKRNQNSWSSEAVELHLW